MLSNFHTHTTFCDGKNTPEEVVLSAIERGFSAIGFSGHAPTPSGSAYCMRDVAGYVAEITRLQEKYRGRIQIYLGAEEDLIGPVERRQFDYIIGSSHYFVSGERYLPIDSSRDLFQKCLELFGGDPLALAERYYQTFCDYITARKPDIVGHFDLITKFDEMGESLFLKNPAYEKIAGKYLLQAAKSGCLFEVNTGAIARGARTTPYPSEQLLHLLKKEGAGLILSSDSHQIETLDYFFAESKKYLYDIGFRELYTLFDGKFVPYAIA